MRNMRAARAGMLVAAVLLIASTTAVAEEAAVATFQEAAGVTKGNSESALALYAKLRAQEGNLLFSPYSVWAALAVGPEGDFLTSTPRIGYVAGEVVEAAGIEPASQSPSVEASTHVVNL